MTLTEAPRKPLPLRARWNVDLSITLYVHHTKVARLKGLDARTSVDDFCTGWFGTEDKNDWRISWTFTRSKKETA